jgi:hypothetical protein
VWRVLTCAVLAVCAAGACGSDEQQQAQVVRTPTPAACTVEADDGWLEQRKQPGADVPVVTAGFIAVWRFESRRPRDKLELSIVSIELRPQDSITPHYVGGWFNGFSYEAGLSRSYSCSGCIRYVDERTLRIDDSDSQRMYTFKIADDFQTVEATRVVEGVVKTFTLDRCQPPQ